MFWEYKESEVKEYIIFRILNLWYLKKKCSHSSMTIPTKCAIWQSSVDSVASFSDPFYIPRN